MPKRFTLAEAERLLPEIEKTIREAISLKTKYQEAEQEIQTFSQRVAMQGGMVIDRESVLRRRTERDQIGDDLRAAVDQTEEFGCIIKDLDIGLVDFPTLFHGKEVYLCWKMGESGINHWHGVDEGFSGRKPIDAHFLENHTGDRAN